MTRCALFCVLALCCACAADDTAAVSSEFAIDGTVRDDLSDDALSGVKVIFVSDTLDTNDTRSDGNGHFAMSVEVRDGVRFGTLHAKLPGYQKSASHTVYFDGTARTVDLRMRAGSD